MFTGMPSLEFTHRPGTFKKPKNVGQLYICKLWVQVLLFFLVTDISCSSESTILALTLVFLRSSSTVKQAEVTDCHLLNVKPQSTWWFCTLTMLVSILTLNYVFLETTSCWLTNWFNLLCYCLSGKKCVSINKMRKNLEEKSTHSRQLIYFVNLGMTRQSTQSKWWAILLIITHFVTSLNSSVFFVHFKLRPFGSFQKKPNNNLGELLKTISSGKYLFYDLSHIWLDFLFIFMFNIYLWNIALPPLFNQNLLKKWIVLANRKYIFRTYTA